MTFVILFLKQTMTFVIHLMTSRKKSHRCIWLLINDSNKKLLEMNIISHNNLIDTIKERNFIEAKEKKLNK